MSQKPREDGFTWLGGWTDKWIDGWVEWSSISSAAKKKIKDENR